MLRIIVILIVLAIIVVLVLASMKPDVFRLERNTRIGAPTDKIFGLINDFHRWAAWSPWEKMDPGMQRTVSGEPSGKGAVYAWKGNKKVGEGRMEILESTSSRIVINLDFLAPFEAHNTAEFTLTPAAGETRVNWSMQGPTPFVGKIMHVFMNMDRMVGKDFEKGLTAMKSVAEAAG